MAKWAREGGGKVRAEKYGRPAWRYYIEGTNQIKRRKARARASSFAERQVTGQMRNAGGAVLHRQPQRSGAFGVYCAAGRSHGALNVMEETEEAGRRTSRHKWWNTNAQKEGQKERRKERSERFACNKQGSVLIPFQKMRNTSKSTYGKVKAIIR